MYISAYAPLFRNPTISDLKTDGDVYRNTIIFSHSEWCKYTTRVLYVYAVRVENENIKIKHSKKRTGGISREADLIISSVRKNSSILYTGIGAGYDAIRRALERLRQEGG